MNRSSVDSLYFLQIHPAVEKLCNHESVAKVTEVLLTAWTIAAMTTKTMTVASVAEACCLSLLSAFATALCWMRPVP
jgi:hypothetical protein